MKTITIEVKGHYSKKTATIRAKISENGKRAEISTCQIKSATDRACYAGTDYLDLPADWESRQDGSAIYYL